MTDFKPLFRLLCLVLVAFFPKDSAAQNHHIQPRSVVEFPNEELAGVWGYAQNGREYALVAASHGMKVVDVTNPDSPFVAATVPHQSNHGGEIRTYRNFAYLSMRGIIGSNAGVLIVDLSVLPDPNLPRRWYRGDGEIIEKLTYAHTLGIDTTTGHLYTFGGSPNQGAIVMDIGTDPWNPKYVGRFTDLGYIHDGFIDNDTLYAAHIYTGLVSVVDMRDKKQPVVLGTVLTPGRFPHNTWLGSDRRVMFSTDEKLPSFLTAYDVTDPSDIFELYRYTPSPKTIAHNTILKDKFAVTSWYTAGLSIADVHRPENIVEVARYDLYPQAENDLYDGCWGVYPWLPSGTLLATEISGYSTNPLPGFSGKLHVLTPEYRRAAHFEGTVVSTCDGQAVPGVSVELLGGQAVRQVYADGFGRFRTGQVDTGFVNLKFSKPGFRDTVLTVPAVSGEVQNLTVGLSPLNPVSLQIRVQKPDGEALPFFKFALVGPFKTFEMATDAQGLVTANCIFGSEFCVISNQWGWQMEISASFKNDTSLLLVPEPGYLDLFETDFGYTTSASLTGGRGEWVRGKPTATFWQGIYPANPPNDAPIDCGSTCYYTGDESLYPQNAIITGAAELVTSKIQIENFTNPVLSFWYWLFLRPDAKINQGSLQAYAVQNGQSKLLVKFTEWDTVWRQSDEISLAAFKNGQGPIQIKFWAAGISEPYLVNLEAAIDRFQIKNGTVSTAEPAGRAAFSVFPNPAAERVFLLETSDSPVAERVRVLDVLGRLMHETDGFSAKNTGIPCVGWPPGVYFLEILDAQNRPLASLKIAKER